ncbi:MAG: RagB/SusD family nutrient uptake outer membrane protein [Chitinophagaceae bacterium]
MIKRYKILFIFLVSSALLFQGCSKWLDVQPKDKFLESDLFRNASGAATALNGMYLLMADTSLYGRDLTMTTLEVLAQRYNISSGHTFSLFQNYQYGEKDVKNNFTGIWEKAYVLIVNANQFVRNLNTYKATDISPQLDSLMRGEAIGLRAMMHFDVLRMFGPIYSKDSTSKSIPYYRNAAPDIAELLPAKQVLDSVLDDLALAEKCLRNDPVIVQGVIAAKGDNGDFWRNRNLRINYYAIKALQARVQLYRGNKTAALEAARAVAEGGAIWFPWVAPSRIISDRANPDRVFSSELIMGMFNLELYDLNERLFAPGLRDTRILAPNDTRLKAVFESNENDYRYNPMWIVPSVGGKTYRTFYKYTDVLETDSLFRFKMPLIRMSEMYYIMAECEPDAAKARTYFNTVRKARGLTDIAATASLATELQKEYQKEFWGEGQLFFFYKRKNVASISNSSATSGTITMDATKYVLPLPLSETQYR